MSVGVGIIFAFLFGLAYIVTPIFFVWGWRSWIKQPRLATITAILSLVGFVLATSSALLALTTMAYAQVHHFGFYDPTLMKLMRWGLCSSAVGLLFGTGGAWRKCPLRWQSLVCSAGTFCVLDIGSRGRVTILTSPENGLVGQRPVGGLNLKMSA